MGYRRSKYVDKLTEAVRPLNLEPAFHLSIELGDEFFKPLTIKHGSRVKRAKRVSRILNKYLSRISSDIDILEAVLRCYNPPSDIAYAVCCWLDAFDRAQGASAREDIRQALLEPGPIEQSIVYSDVVSSDSLIDDYVD